jgi:asparagine synthase (glutamine-hydrolysing)
VSIVFGILKPSGAVVTREELCHLASATDRYAPDGVSVAAQGQIGMGVQPYHTHERSNLESQPLVDRHGNMLVLDGRIDNYAELSDLLDIRDYSSPDSLIVLAAFRRWGEECFSRLIGDWALVIWSNVDHTLYLARDHAGTRTLYFERTVETIQWSTYLETFFTLHRKRDLDENYAARYLACHPLGDLTPYKGIKSVSPAHFVKLRDGAIEHKAHWQSIIAGMIRYRNDSEYDDHFLTLFRQSVKRRTGPGAPILAQLSGGMDSSSIVCVSDEQRSALGASPNDLLDTISFYNDSEPDWNERPFFSIVEAKRKKAGFHVDSYIFNGTLEPPEDTAGNELFPGRDSSTIERERFIEALISGCEFRVILSGIGGDEVLGGVPTPLPELSDLLWEGKLSSLLTRGIAWCLPGRVPLIHTLCETVANLFQFYLLPQGWKKSLPPWIQPDLRRLCKEALRDDATRFTRFGHIPSSVHNGLAWWSIMETLPHANPNALFRFEYRYPYLDRELVEFLFRVPREQLLQPGRRRLLMRRALKGIVPEEILERRRKAFLSRSSLMFLASARERVETLTAKSSFVAAGNLDCREIMRALNNVIEKRDDRWAQALLRTAYFLLWLNSTPALHRTTVPSSLIAAD